MDKLSTSLLISSVIIIKNDPITKSNKLINGYTGKKDDDQIDEVIENCYEFKENLDKLKNFFSEQFLQAKYEKSFFEIDRKLTEVNSEDKKEKKPTNTDTKEKTNPTHIQIAKWTTHPKPSIKKKIKLPNSRLLNSLI
jgi:hypothetical protein